MMSIVSMLGMSSCEDRLDSPCPSTGGGKTVEVSLCVGIADEVDAASLNAGSSGTKSVGTRNNGAFDVRLVPAAVRTKADALASAKPDQLHNLQILQYDSNRNFKKLTPTVSQATGSTLTVDLVACENCQLIIVARGSSNAISEFSGSPSWSDLQGRLADASTINGIGDGGTNDINAMPYFIHLKNVNVTNEGKIVIQSADGSDARILLKRLAVRLTVNWKFAEGLRTGYTLKEVKLCQVPTVYYLMSPTETDSRFEGDLYPISTVEYKDLYRLKGVDATNEGSLTTWMPANAKGKSRSVTSEYYRTKEYAHTSATYMEFVVDNNDGLERMYYRAYLGGKDVSDFNLLENTNYHYTINIRNTDYRGDPRIRLLDQTPVISTNLVQTSNCFMMRPGTNICFNPYKHEAGSGGENTYLSDKTIGSVRVLWQSKDAGTSGDLVMGYAVSNEAGSYNHQNLVNYTNIGDRANALVHVRVPVTQGGNAVIAAYAVDGATILWSWHLWITDYVPARLSGTITAANREEAIRTAKSASAGGTVHTYAGDAWTDATSGAFFGKVIMDRNLGALRNTWSTTNPLESARAYGNIYQWGRKDPMPGSADGGRDDKGLMFNGDGEIIDLEKVNSNSLENTIRNPSKFHIGYKAADGSWGPTAKALYDPCPAGWRVPDFDDTAMKNIWSGFSWGTNKFQMLVNSDWKTTGIAVNKNSFHIMNGIKYETPQGDYAWFPFFRMREISTGLLRDPERNIDGTPCSFNGELAPSFSLFGANSRKNYYNEYGWYIEFKYNLATTPSATVSGKAYGFAVRCVQAN